jgi:hypothetical protein
MFFPKKNTNIRIRFLYPNTKQITASGEKHEPFKAREPPQQHLQLP